MCLATQNYEFVPMSRILIAVLNWGMGHASRTLPIIEGALELGWEVDVASTGDAMVWLKRRLKENDRVKFFEKPGASIVYSKHFTMLTIAAQTPKLIKSIFDEKQWTREHVLNRNISKIFSDNCYGVYHKDVPAILMTHLLRFPVAKVFSPFAQIVVRNLAGRFNEVWVPDNHDGEDSLAGVLTSKNIHKNTKFIGVLSRLKPFEGKSEFLLVGLVSGPEPHRSIMEKALRSWMRKKGGKGLIIAGKPGGGNIVSGNITTLYDPSDDEISAAISGAETLICRSGYTTLLDLASLGKRAILIATPGQKEQEILSEFWADKYGFAICTQQELEKLHVPEISGIAPKTSVNKTALNELAAWLQK
jgi:hypothetical protein